MVSWEEILLECDEADQGYRQRLVAIFRRYEYQETDERDGSNRIIKVTVTSFANHLGIVPETFRLWVDPSKRSSNTVGSPQADPEPEPEPTSNQRPQAEPRPAPGRGGTPQPEPEEEPLIQINYREPSLFGVSTNPMTPIGDALAAEDCLNVAKKCLEQIHTLVVNQKSTPFQEAILLGLDELVEVIFAVRSDITADPSSLFEEPTNKEM